jgi:hypothetical protein
MISISSSDEALRMWPVSRRVDRSGQDDDPGLTEPLSAADADA